MIAQVGTISANNERDHWEDYRRGHNKVGKDGVITVEEAKTLETQLEVVGQCSSTADIFRLTL